MSGRLYVLNALHPLIWTFNSGTHECLVEIMMSVRMTHVLEINGTDDISLHLQTCDHIGQIKLQAPFLHNYLGNKRKAFQQTPILINQLSTMQGHQQEFTQDELILCIDVRIVGAIQVPTQALGNIIARCIAGS